MPTRSLTACTYPGCGIACEGGRCSRHPRKVWEKPSGRNAFYDSPEWRKARKATIKRDPICKECKQAKSTHADHKTAMRDGGAPLDPKNLQGVCHTCHARKTRYEQLKRAGREVVSIKKQAVQPIWDD